MAEISKELQSLFASPEEITAAKSSNSGGVTLREKYPNDPKVQGVEHGNYVESILHDNPDLVPILAPLGAVAIPLYQAAKSTELGRDLVKTTDKPASKPSLDQMKGGYEGLGRGLTNYLSKEFFNFMGITVDEKKPTGEKSPSSVLEVRG